MTVEVAVHVEVRAVVAQAGDHAQPFGGLQLLFDVQSPTPKRCTESSRIVDDARAIVGEIQAHMPDVIETRIDAEAQRAREAAVFGVARELGVHAVCLAVVELLELVAIHRVEGIGEVGEQIELVVERVGIAVAGSSRRCGLPISRFSA